MASPPPPDLAAFLARLARALRSRRLPFMLIGGQAVLLHGVDFVFSTTPYERHAIERAVTVELAGEAVPFASAEDLIVHKLFAGRPVDWEDALSVVRRKGRSIDWAYVERWALEFAGVPGREDLPGRVQRLRSAGD